MIVKLILALAVLAFIFWFARGFKRLPPQRQRQLALKILFYGVLVLIVLAVLTGRLHWLGAVVAAVLGLAKFGFSAAMRGLPLVNFLRKNQAFTNPVFRTEFLEVELDLQRGDIHGRVLAGPLAGESLQHLGPEQLHQLEQHYRERCLRSYYLIRVIQQRGGAQRQRTEDANYGSAAAPSVDEALLILGLRGTPQKQEIIQAHRRLIQKLHPDRGGNDYLASRVNLAKDILIKHFYAK